MMKEALEQSFSLLEFWGFSSFDRWKLIEDEDGTNLFVNVKKAIEANCRKSVTKISFIFEKVRKDDTTFMEEASHERLVDLPFMTDEASGMVIHVDVVCGVAMINLNGIRHNAPKGYASITSEMMIMIKTGLRISRSASMGRAG
nr:hypothetical protein [Tanacetum cinerariifolium]